MPTKKDLAKLVVKLEAESTELRKELKKTNNTLVKWERNVSRSVGRAKKQFDKLRYSVIAAAAALVGGKFVGVQREFAVLSTSLETATGSAEQAAKEFSKLEDFAKSTPFALQESVNAFVKLKNLGLDPNIKALRSYGNTASALGKTLDQFIEAVADASVGEFERLKEFGIKASKQGDIVRFTFRGITKEVAFNSKAIEGYLQNIGNVEFAGAMERRAKTLDGALSNLGDSFAGLVRTIGDAGVTKVLASLANKIGEMATVATDAVIAVRGLWSISENSENIKLITSRIASLKAEIKDLSNNRNAGAFSGQLRRAREELAGLEARLSKLKEPAAKVGKALGDGLEGAGKQIEELTKKLESQADAFKKLVKGTRETIAGDQSNPLTKGTIVEITRALDKAKSLQTAGDLKGQLEAATKAVEAIKAASEAGNISKYFANDLLGQAENLGVSASDKMLSLKLDDAALASEAERAREMIQSNFDKQPFKVWISPNTDYGALDNPLMDKELERQGAK